MTVYIEVVVFNNLMLDAVLILSVLLIRRRKLKWWRIVLSAVIGAGVAVGFAIAPSGFQIAIRILLAPLMTAVFDRYKNYKDYILSLFIFAMFTFALGGIVTGLSNLLSIELTGYPVLGAVALGVVVGLIALKFVINKRSHSAKTMCDAVIVFGGSTYAVKAMCDTGNSLTDTLSGLPVIIVSETLERKIVALECGKIEGFIEVKTINGGGSMPLIKFDSVKIGDKTEVAYGALSRQNFGEYDVILQNTMF